MDVMLLIYLVSLGLCTWFGPKIVAITDTLDIRSEVSNKHAVAGFFLGLMPIINILFIFFGGWLLARSLKVLNRGSAEDIRKFNEELRDMMDG
jgi:hypothetical protein